MRESQHQWEFLKDLAQLIHFASTLEGVMLTGGDLYQDNEWHEEHSDDDRRKGSPPWPKFYPHLKNGYHPKRKAIDLNLFVDGMYVVRYHEVWDELGPFWCRLNPLNRWGGDFTKRDYNHFERRDEEL